MALGQLKAKYAASILGISWAIINPLLIMFVISFIFTQILKTEIKNYPIFILAGILPWMFFSNTLTEASTSIISQKNILRQFSLPREILPLSSMLSNFLNFLIGWLIIFPLFVFFNPKILMFLPFLIVVLLLHFVFVCGLGLLFSVLNVFFRDVNHLLGALLMFWFWITPVFYSLDMIPGQFHWIFNINPMTSYIIFYRDVVFEGFIPAPSIWISIILWAIFSCILGFWIFSQFESKILKQI